MNFPHYMHRYFIDTSPPTSTSVISERPVSAPIISSNSELSNDRVKENTSEVTLSLRRPKSNSEDKGNLFASNGECLKCIYCDFYRK